MRAWSIGKPITRVVDHRAEVADIVDLVDAMPVRALVAPIVPDLTKRARHRQRGTHLLGERGEPRPLVKGGCIDPAAMQFEE